MADTTGATIVHTVEVVRYDDPVITIERVTVSAFIAGYTDPTRRSYATDLRIFAAWCHDHGINLLSVKRPHLEMFARWMEQEGRMASTIGRRLSHGEKPRAKPTLARRCATTVPGAASTGTPPTSCRRSSPVRRVRVEPLDINYSNGLADGRRNRWRGVDGVTRPVRSRRPDQMPSDRLLPRRQTSR
jgi:hypothetical protein